VSRAWTAKPHYAGSDNDYTSALEQLEVFQKHFGINPPKSSPVFDAGSAQSRQAILSIPNITEPTAWIDTYYPWLNTPAERKLEILNEDGTPFWSANVEETPAEGDPAGQWHDAVGAWHGLSKGGDVRVSTTVACSIIISFNCVESGQTHPRQLWNQAGF
jgi:N-acetylated-alpha-linked acidic dipeptidase